ncbi:sulfatase-like hydrolase/transferase [Novosphingobium sp. PP1Y]|uniref:sulfatase-like hydrolase/transferase n=1 Tax=Novosphingobium sp. PP1Y TaxID=702113 RepID=UPI00020EE61B|nr:sulfatase-like hydrolase/transferase [Novosphingobium sp. PP1Y]CCA89990.1 sulfatase [Novosphingobium sp. PP1Y]
MTVDRRTVLGLLGTALAAPRTAFAAPARRPNLVLFMPDELRADVLSCYGNPVTLTPNFDALARQGTRFANCHVQYPICSPSRCSMLTGWPPSVRGHRSQFARLRPDEPNMFRYLREAGYDVFWVGKNDALTQECFRDSVTEWQSQPILRFGGGPLPSVDTATMVMRPGEAKRTDTTDYACIQQAVQWLERRETDRPFCIFIASWEPHPPYRAPADFATMYKPADLPPLIPAGLAKKPDFHAAIRGSHGLDRIDDAALREVRAAYYGQVSYTDWLLGELMEAMERTGRSRDTALFVASDHGDYAGDYGLIEKWPSDLTSCLTHVPLIGRVPGLAGGQAASDMVELFDIMPTFLGLAGTRTRHTHFARSLLPQMHGLPGDPDRAAFSEGGMNVYEPQAFETNWPGPFYKARIELPLQHPETISRCAAIKTRRYTYVRRPQGQDELYDRAADPAETNNLIDAHTHASAKDSLERRLLDWYVNTSGVPPTDRDNASEMPPYSPPPQTLPGSDAETVARILNS